MARLGDICTIQSGGTPSRGNKDYWENGTIPWVKISDFSGKYLDHTSEKITHTGLDNSSAKIFLKGTILYTIFATLGETCILDIDAATNQAIAGLTLNDDSVSPDYLYYYLLSKKEYVNEIGRGVAQNNINTKILRDMEIYIPSAEDQAKATKALNRVYLLIALRKEQIAKLEQLVKSRFIELVGDTILNPKEWPICELSEHIQFITSGSRGWSQYFTESGEYFITIKNVKNCRIMLDDVQYVVPPDNAEAKRTRVQEGDLLISITADLGRTGVVTKEIADYGGYINQHLTCIRLNQDAVRPLYVAYYMESEAGKSQFQSKNQSAVKAGLNFNSINSLKLMVPPIELQDAFITFVEQTDKSKLAIQQSLEKLETLKKTLMQKYFG